MFTVSTTFPKLNHGTHSHSDKDCHLDFHQCPQISDVLERETLQRTYARAQNYGLTAKGSRRPEVYTSFLLITTSWGEEGE